jgi:hypothetical protein
MGKIVIIILGISALVALSTVIPNEAAQKIFNWCGSIVFIFFVIKDEIT